MPLIKTAGLLYRPRLPDAPAWIARIERILREMGIGVWVGVSWDEAAIAERVPALDLLITLGGDGTMLRAARIAAPRGIPLVGIQLGHLGFMAEINADEIESKLAQLSRDDYWLEERMMLRATHQRGAQLLGRYEALNDVVVTRGAAPRVIRPSISIDGAPLISYVADGVIIATPTGSTAYNLSAGGPVAAPDVRALLLTPVAPHLAPARTFVISSQSQIALDVHMEYDAILCVDGQTDIQLADGDRIIVETSAHTAKFARFHPRAHFYETLLERLRSPNR
jgi:NAD+ kinase